MFDLEGYVHEIWVLWRGSAFSCPIVAPPSLWGTTAKLCLTHGHGAVPFPAQQTPHGNSLGNNHLTQQQSHKLRITYQRDTSLGVCLLFQKAPSSSSSLSPSLLPAFFSCTCIRIRIFQVYVLMKWKENGMSPNLKTSTPQSHLWEKCRDAILTQSQISYLKYIFI